MCYDWLLKHLQFIRRIDCIWFYCLLLYLFIVKAEILALVTGEERSNKWNLRNVWKWLVFAQVKWTRHSHMYLKSILETFIQRKKWVWYRQTIQFSAQSGMITRTVCHYILNNGVLCNIYVTLISACHMVFRSSTALSYLSYRISTF